VKDSHCQENLNFLVQIFHYEKIWNKIFKRQSSILKCKEESLQQQRKQSTATIFTNASSLKLRHQSIVEEPETSENIATAKKNIESKELQRLSGISQLSREKNEQSNVLLGLKLPTVTSADLDPSSFTNKDIDCDTHSVDSRPRKLTANSMSTNHEVWDSLFKASYWDEQKPLEDGASLTGDHESDIGEDQYNESVKQLEIREQLKEELSEKFNFIVETYVKPNSLNEINLPSDVYTNLIKESENNKVLYHSPLTLLPAKNAVLQLLRENIYYKFISAQERLMKEKERNEPKPTEDLTQINSVLAASDITLTPVDSETVRSVSSTGSLKDSSTPISTLSNFWNKYHFKIHSGGSSSSIPSLSNKDSDESLSRASIDSFKIHTRSPSGNVEENHHLQDGTRRYIKGPCNISPTTASYDPKPPNTTSDLKSKWGSKFLKFKMKKKTNVSPPSSPQVTPVTTRQSE
jgi:hypothetical protein